MIYVCTADAVAAVDMSQCLAKLLTDDCFDIEAESYLLAKRVCNTQLEHMETILDWLLCRLRLHRLGVMPFQNACDMSGTDKQGCTKEREQTL